MRRRVLVHGFAFLLVVAIPVMLTGCFESFQINGAAARQMDPICAPSSGGRRIRNVWKPSADTVQPSL